MSTSTHIAIATGTLTYTVAQTCIFTKILMINSRAEEGIQLRGPVMKYLDPQSIIL